MAYVYREALATDLDWLQERFPQNTGYSRPDGYFEGLLARSARGELNFLLALTSEGDYVGHLKLMWHSRYPYYHQNGIPEIQDVVVAPAHRQQGVASRLIGMAEKMALERSDEIGIAFGLYADYGSAQRLYARLGYRPLGFGAFYDGKPVVPGESVMIDDSLTFALIKTLRPSGEQIQREWAALYLNQGLVRVHYPTVTPAGHPVDLIAKQLGDGQQLHLISRDSKELYFELGHYPSQSVAAVRDKMLSSLQSSVGIEISNGQMVQLAEVPAERYLLTFPDRRRVLNFFVIAGQSCRLIMDPDAHLNHQILNTICFDCSYAFS